MTLLSVPEALARVTEGIEPLAAERVPLAAARGRVLAQDLRARLTQPPFDASAMDGYALRGADVSSLPANLKLVGQSAAGAGFAGEIRAGETVRIFTGAPVPRGADTVVLQEDAEQTGDVITVKAGRPGAHIRPQGQDFTEGEMLLKAGTRLGARELMLAAAMNHAELAVRCRPKVAVLATGDELVPPGSKLAPDQIVSSVPFGLSGLIEAVGGEAMMLGIAKDDLESLTTLARTGSAAEILLTIGGASVGDRDLVGAALRKEGLELSFWKIAMRPGKPLLHGRLGQQRVLGLPGNPVSAFVCARVFLVPMLELMLGARPEEGSHAEAVLDCELEANGSRQHYLRAISTWTDKGERRVRPVPSQDSSLVAALARADCLIVRPPDAPPAERGAYVEILSLKL